ncbi:MAG: radical SAM protein [Bryobacterales bacterium]|nr:radical SAM protein [Bryobacterales bacterium]
MRRMLARKIKRHVGSARVRERFAQLETAYEAIRNSFVGLYPGVATPSLRMLTLAITAKCNFRCVGCRYGRDYMGGSELSFTKVEEILSDAAAAGVSTVRLYGGEPLLHRDLPAMIAKTHALGMTPFVSTNGFLLDRRVGALVDAGLRILSFGYYGHGAVYDRYVGREGAWGIYEQNIAATRERYQDQLRLDISFVLNTRTCSLGELERAWTFAKRYELRFHVDLIHYSLPYFTEGLDRELQFKSGDSERITEFVDQLALMKTERPGLFREPMASIRSIPDWLLLGPDMKVPCDAYNMLWVGADGSVRLCFADFPLGNIHQTPLRELIGTPAHRQACRDAAKLNCVNCHCGRGSRVLKHLPSLLRYTTGNLITEGHLPLREPTAVDGRSEVDEESRPRTSPAIARTRILPPA